MITKQNSAQKNKQMLDYIVAQMMIWRPAPTVGSAARLKMTLDIFSL